MGKSKGDGKGLWMVTVGEWNEGESSIFVFDDVEKARLLLEEKPSDPWLHKTMYGPFGIGDDAFLAPSATREFPRVKDASPRADVPGMGGGSSFDASFIYRGPTKLW